MRRKDNPNEARGEDARSLQLKIECLKEQLASRTKALFGDSSERRPCAEHEKTEQRNETCLGHGPREQKALPIVEVVLDEIRTWLMTQRALPRSGLGRVIAYTGGLWPGLVRLLENPKIPLDTNGVERALRGVAVGRNNHYGSRSERGTRVAALFYSLIESAKLAGVEPRAYLCQAARRATRNPGTVTLARELKPLET